MRAIREQRGQTGPEYAGVLLLVALIVSALASGPLQPVAASTAEAVHCIATGGHCPPDDGDYPSDGSPISGRPIFVLPFPGSVAVELVGADAGDRLGVKGVVTAIARRGPEVLDERGCLTVALSMTVDMRITGKLKHGSPTLGGAIDGFVGAGSTYTVNVSPEQADAMQDGGDAANSVDPTTLTVGGSIVLNEETYKGWGMEAQYRGLVMSSGHREGDRVATGVTRVNESTVRVHVGEERFVEQAVRTGVGIPGLNIGFSSTHEDVEGKLRQIDLDISTQAGWDAYQQFVASGELPGGDAPGVTDAADVDQERWRDRDELAGQIGPIRASMLTSDADGYRSRERHADGSVVDSLSSRLDDVTLLSQTRTDPDGAGDTTYALLLHDARGASLEGYERHHGDFDAETDDTANFRIDYTARDLMGIRQQVYETIAQRNSYGQGGILDGATAEDVEAYYEQLGDDPHEGGFALGMTDSTWIDAIARADAPEEVLGAIVESGRGNPHELLGFLNTISSETAAYRGVELGEAGTPGSFVRLDGSECR